MRKSNLRRVVLNRRVDLHAIDATPARWRGDVGCSPLDGASASDALISTQAIATNDVAIGDVARTALEELERGIKEASDFEDELFEEFDRLNQAPESAHAWI